MVILSRTIKQFRDQSGCYFVVKSLHDGYHTENHLVATNAEGLINWFREALRENIASKRMTPRASKTVANDHTWELVRLSSLENHTACNKVRDVLRVLQIEIHQTHKGTELHFRINRQDPNNIYVHAVEEVEQ